MTFAPWPTAVFVMAAPDAGSRASITMTVAPEARHASACAFIFCASPWALLIDAETPAARRSFVRYGRSKSSYRADDLVSGSRTQAWVAAFFAVRALAAATTDAAIARAASMKTPHRLLRFMKSSGFLSLEMRAPGSEAREQSMYYCPSG